MKTNKEEVIGFCQELKNEVPDKTPAVEKYETNEEAVSKKENNKKNIDEGIVIDGKLNVRKRPNVNSDIIKVLDDGCKIVILSDKDANFYKVQINEFEGYCMKKFIKKV